MTMHESFPQPVPSPERNFEKKVSDLGVHDTVLRNGTECTITSYRTNAANEVEITFSDGGMEILEKDDTLVVPK